METQPEQSTTITINRQVYRVRCSDPKQVDRLAKFVDERIREISTRTATVDSLKVAVLAALNIADDYFSARDELESLKTDLSVKTEGMVRKLEPFLVDSSPEEPLI